MTGHCDSVAASLMRAPERLAWSDGCYYSCLEFRRLERLETCELLPGWNLATLKIQGIALAVVVIHSFGSVPGMTWRLCSKSRAFSTPDLVGHDLLINLL